jgi:class 3 adenylate cyclase/tetratricopeptide (TPR) repeat protein
MRCSKCESENPAGKRFCGDCGAPLANRCPECGADNPLRKRFCSDCGTALSPSNTSRRSHPAFSSAPDVGFSAQHPVTATVEGERKTVTALFADIRGSTELMEDLDPEEARAIIDPALKLMIEAVRRYDGYIVQSTGDGIFALFGAPVAHEDHPQRALYAALRLQDATRRYSAKLVADGGTPLEARVGVNTGEVVVRTLTTADGHTEYAPIGHTANLASRMQAVAPTGSIAITEHTRQLVEGYFQLKSRGPSRVRGMAEPINVYEVTAIGPLRTRLQRAAARGLTKFVGRERDMDALRHALEQAKAGHGQIVAAIGDPGVGKSRLFHEFKATSPSGCMVLEAFSVSHGKASAYLPVIDLLHGYFGITSEDDGRRRREKLGGRVLMLDLALEDALPYLFSLLGIADAPDPLAQMDGQVKKRRTLDVIKRVLLRESLNQALIVMFEDLHWIDGETQALLNLLADGIANARILLMVNYRPEYHHEWGNRSHYVQLRLDPLGSQSAAEMLSGLLGKAPELVPIKRTIIERTEGNPFFIEELVQALFDEGLLVRNGIVKLGRSVPQLRIPPTAQAVLAARIDWLSAEQKELLQTLAVIGREFPVGLIRSLVQLSDVELDRMLRDLQLAEFIYEQPAFPEADYIFKHALTQEVAYNSILLERRKQIHEQTAQAIEALFDAHLPDHYADLARHYVRSGNVPKALNYLHLAAQQAMTRSAYEEAYAQLAAALELLRTQVENPERDRTEIALALSLARCTISGGDVGWTEATVSGAQFVDILEKASGLCEKLGDEASLFEVLWALLFRHNIRLDHQKVRLIADQLLAIAAQSANPAISPISQVQRARTWLGFSLLYQGQFVDSQRELDLVYQLSPGAPSEREQAIEVYPSGTAGSGVGWLFFDSRIVSRAFGSLNCWVLGYPDRASMLSGEALTMCRQEIASPSNLVLALYSDGMRKLFLHNWEAAYSGFEEAVRVAHENSYTASMAVATIAREWALARRGPLEERLSQILQWRPAVAGLDNLATVWAFMARVDICLAARLQSQGLEAVEDALAIGERTGTRFNEAELRRLKGELLLLGRNEDEAAQCFRDAIAIARRQSAKAWELRATTSLARLLAKQGHPDEAQNMLSEIYGWFAEGFETADLKDAKALLGELSS